MPIPLPDCAVVLLESGQWLKLRLSEPEDIPGMDHASPGVGHASADCGHKFRRVLGVLHDGQESTAWAETDPSWIKTYYADSLKDQRQQGEQEGSEAVQVCAVVSTWYSRWSCGQQILCSSSAFCRQTGARRSHQM
jgi:hypothetical protein